MIELTTEAPTRDKCGELRKAWTGFRIAKARNDTEKMKQYAERIDSLQAQLGLAKTEFKVLDRSLSYEIDHSLPSRPFID